MITKKKNNNALKNNFFSFCRHSKKMKIFYCILFVMVITIATNSCDARRPAKDDDCMRENKTCGSHGPCCPGLYCDWQRNVCLRFY